MRRVLHVLHNLERSGMEIMLLNSRTAWRRHGYECDVLATADEPGPLVQSMRAAGYLVFHFPLRGRFRRLPRLDSAWRFFRLCRSGYDVVHIHTESGPPLFTLIARLAGVRRIAVTPHNTFRFDGLLRWRKLCERFFVRLLGGRYGMISDGVRDCEQERFANTGVPISNWIDTVRFRPPTTEERLSARHLLGTRPQDFILVSIGNCNRAKNHEVVLRAIPLLPTAMRPLYVHIGREEPDHSERRLATDLGIHDRVLFLGSQTDVLPYLWAADAFVMPSLHEGLGVAAIEAVAAGALLICSHVAGISDVAEATASTILTSTTPESVAEGIAYAASLPVAELRGRALSDSASVRERYSIQQGVQSVVTNLYDEDEPSLLRAEQAWRHS
jgi:glycosyltransferase involved in cell wall biosynthesis